MTSLTTESGGAEVGRQKYLPFGSPRVQSGTLKDRRFTGQRSEEANFGSLYDYGARFYSPILGRFVSPNAIIPAPDNPQNLNRYTYVQNNPLRYTDPTGHCPMCVSAGVGGFLGGLAGAGRYSVNVLRSGQDWNLNDALTVAASGSVAGALIGTYAPDVIRQKARAAFRGGPICCAESIVSADDTAARFCYASSREGRATFRGYRPKWPSLRKLRAT